MSNNILLTLKLYFTLHTKSTPSSTPLLDSFKASS